MSRSLVRSLVVAFACLGLLLGQAAGAGAAAAEDDRLEPGDLDRAVLMMASFMGDGDHLPNGTHDDPSYLDHQHGDGALRAWWFLQGFNGGAEACGL